MALPPQKIIGGNVSEAYLDIKNAPRLTLTGGLKLDSNNNMKIGLGSNLTLDGNNDLNTSGGDASGWAQHKAEKNVDMDGNKVVGLADPTNAQEAATRNYVNFELRKSYAPLGDALTVAYSFDNNGTGALNDGDTINDDSGNGNAGTVDIDSGGVAKLVDNGGIIETGLNMFNDTTSGDQNAVFSIPKDALPSNNSDFSISFWFKSGDDFGTLSEGIISTGVNEGTGGNQIELFGFEDNTNDTLTFRYPSTNAFGANITRQETNLGANLNSSAWHHVVITGEVSSDILTLLIDNNGIVRNNDWRGDIKGDEIHIGNKGNGSRGMKVDEIVGFNRVLTNSEITEFYNSGNGKSPEIGGLDMKSNPIANVSQLFLNINNLPTSDLGKEGQVWNDNGTLKISSGPT